MGQGTTNRIEPPLPEQQQRVPGATEAMHPKPDHGEDSYEGSGRLEGKRVVITGGDSGIGRAVSTPVKASKGRGGL